MNDSKPEVALSRSANNSTVKKQKRKSAIITTGKDEFSCPVCMEFIKEAFITKCGHSFCYECISQHLEYRLECPICRKHLKKDHIFPNFLLNKLLQKRETVESITEISPVKTLQISIKNDPKWSVSDINVLVNALLDKKRKIEASEDEIELQVLQDFLSRAKKQKEEQLATLKSEISILNEDLKKSEELTAECHSSRVETTTVDATPVKRIGIPDEEELVPDLQTNPRVNDSQNGQLDVSTDSCKFEHPSSLISTRIHTSDRISSKKRRVYTHFEDLENYYFKIRQSIFNGGSSEQNSLKSFSQSLSKITRFSSFNCLASVKYGDMFTSSSIVSSIEFDRDEEYFATAGVTKKIKIFEYGSILNDPVDIHYPIKEMSCHSKISCLSWNSYVKSQIASSDYEGIVSLWDAYCGQITMQFEEHTKRAWCVDFSQVDPTKLASGSDDTKVKIWSTNMENSVTCIESKANVCCVKFNPEISHHIAFGSADHHIHYYDLRKAGDPLFVFKGHRKAVSYVKFLNSDEIISASTDSTLKLWSISKGECIRTFTGHSNEKNFVGLTTNGEYIACGSENNSVYAFYKALSKPIVSYKFGCCNPLTGEDHFEDSSQFVSSVCWKKDSNILLAANSQGTIKVLDLM